MKHLKKFNEEIGNPKLMNDEKVVSMSVRHDSNWDGPDVGSETPTKLIIKTDNGEYYLDVFSNK